MKLASAGVLHPELLSYPVLAELIEGILLEGRSPEDAAELRAVLAGAPAENIGYDETENLVGVTVAEDDYSVRARRVRRARVQAMIDAGRLSGPMADLRIALADATSAVDHARIDREFRARAETRRAALTREAGNADA